MITLVQFSTGNHPDPLGRNQVSHGHIQVEGSKSHHTTRLSLRHHDLLDLNCDLISQCSFLWVIHESWLPFLFASVSSHLYSFDGDIKCLLRFRVVNKHCDGIKQGNLHFHVNRWLHQVVGLNVVGKLGLRVVDQVRVSQSQGPEKFVEKVVSHPENILLKV